MEYEEDGIGSNLVELYVRLRIGLGADFRGMDPIDSSRAPIAMSILRYAAQNLSIAEIEGQFDPQLDSRTCRRQVEGNVSNEFGVASEQRNSKKRMERPMKEIFTAIAFAAKGTN